MKINTYTYFIIFNLMSSFTLPYLDVPFSPKDIDERFLLMIKQRITSNNENNTRLEEQSKENEETKKLFSAKLDVLEKKIVDQEKKLNETKEALKKTNVELKDAFILGKLQRISWAALGAVIGVSIFPMTFNLLSINKSTSKHQ